MMACDLRRDRRRGMSHMPTSWRFLLSWLVCFWCAGILPTAPGRTVAVVTAFPMMVVWNHQPPPSRRIATVLSASAEELRQHAERLRAEATEMEEKHLQHKLQAIQRQLLKHPKHMDPMERETLQQQEELLRKRMEVSKANDVGENQQHSAQAKLNSPVAAPPHVVSSSTTNNNTAITVTNHMSNSPIAYSPFPAKDLESYLQLIQDGNWSQTMNPDISMIQEFQRQVRSMRYRQMFQAPLRKMEQLEEIKTSYLQSTSSLEKKHLARQWDKLTMNNMPTASIPVLPTVKFVGELSETELERRVAVVQSLPKILQGLFQYIYTIQRNSDQFHSTSLTLPILIQHYSPRLDQITEQPSLWDEIPEPIQMYYGGSLEAFNETYCSPAWFETSTINVVFQQPDAFFESSRSLEYLDRSRYLKEFYPMEDIEAVTSMAAHLDHEEPELNDYLKGISYTARDPVLGGYLLRGVSETAIRTLRMRTNGNFSCYWIPDPSPQTDEMIETGSDVEPVLFVTKQTFDGHVGKPVLQCTVSILALASTAVFSLFGTNDLVDSVVEANVDDILTVAGGLLFLQAVHETGHRVVAWKECLDMNAPTLVPSPVLGLQGAITALRSPPQNMKSLFDFGMAGPLSGLLMSILMLLQGLEWTAATSYGGAASSTSLPVSVLHASQLGGILVEFFLGNGMLSVEQLSRIALHPLAIAGYCGILTNAAALLPIGNTDGGRLSIAIFGRRGAYVVSKFTTVLLCISGLVGLDDSGFLLTYALFCVIWQKNMEVPVQDEVTKLDLPRTVLGFLVAPVVVVALLPAV